MQLPAPELVNYYRLAENRIFYIDFEIDESVLEIQKAILNINLEDKNIEVTDRKPIVIVLDTPGGLLSETFCLVHTIMMSKTPVITVNACECYSGGALLLLSGHKRYAFPDSWAMIHSGSSGSGGTFEQNEEYQKMYKRKVESMRKIHFRTNRPWTQRCSIEIRAKIGIFLMTNRLHTVLLTRLLQVWMK